MFLDSDNFIFIVLFKAILCLFLKVRTKFKSSGKEFTLFYKINLKLRSLFLFKLVNHQQVSYKARTELTRMHSSMMRTARLLPVSPHMHCSRGVYLWGGCLVGGVPAWGVYMPRGVYLPRGVPTQGVCLPGGVPAWGLYLPRGRGYLSRYSPPVNRMTDRCKNITLPQTSFAGGNNTTIRAKTVVEN